MSIQETLIMIALALAPAFFSMLGLAGFGSPAIAVLGEVTAKSRKRVFFDKYGQQVATMGLTLMTLLMVVYGIGSVIAYAKFPAYVKAVVAQDSPLINTMIATGVLVVAGILHALTWKKLKNAKAAHIMLGMVAALACFMTVALAVPAKLSFFLSLTKEGATINPAAGTMVLPVSAMYTFLILASAAGLSCAYLVLRRNKDDFGRDYYRFSLNMSARWATLPMIGFLGCQGWLFARLPQDFKTLVIGTPLVYVWVGLVCLGAVCTFIWFLIGRSEKPMTLKGLAFLNVLLFWFVHALNVTVVFNLLSML